jgi:hypothetical protein
VDGTVGSDIGHLEQTRTWWGRPLWDMEPADADAYFGGAGAGIRAGVRRALIILWSDVLDQRGILLDDRRPCFEDWLDGQLDELTRGIAGEVQTWLRSLRGGGPPPAPHHRDRLALRERSATHPAGMVRQL